MAIDTAKAEKIKQATREFWVVELLKDAASKLVFSTAIYWSGQLKADGQGVATVDIYAAKKYTVKAECEADAAKLPRAKIGEWAAVQHGWM